MTLHRETVIACAEIARKHRERIVDHNPDVERDDLVAQGYGNAALNIECEIRALPTSPGWQDIASALAEAERICRERAEYFRRSNGHYDRDQAARSYDATADKIAALSSPKAGKPGDDRP